MNRRLAVIGAVVLVVLAVVAIATRRDGGDDGRAGAEGSPSIGREGSVVVAGGEPVAIARTPAAYSITYRVQTAGGSSMSVVTDVVTARRPWESRLQTSDGEPPGGEVFSSRVGWFLRTALVQANAQPSIIETAPGTPPSDVRVDRSIPLAIEHERIERREVREVAGRRCQVYRSRDTLSAVMAPAAEDDYVDSCVDDAGLVLEEVVVANGDPLTRRVAVEVSESPTLEDGMFRAEGPSVEAKQGGGFVRKLKEGSMPPGEFLVTDRGPDGFEYLGRFSVVPAQPENFGDDPLRESFRRASVVDAWQRGHDFIAIDQGGTLRGADAFPPTEGAPKMALGEFGDAELLLSGAGVELRADRANGRYLRVYGTVGPDELVALAQSLRAVEGNTLEFAG